MKSLKTGLSVLIVGLVLAPTAAGQPAVPPDNPAAVQYTEAYPTSRGPTDAEGEHKNQRDADQALDGRDAERLEAQGQAGREAARVAAETAPETVGGRTVGGGTGSGSPKNGAGGSGVLPAPGGGGSGLGDVAGQATGLSSSDDTPLLLPLVLLGGIAWAVFYLTRRRREAAR